MIVGLSVRETRGATHIGLDIIHTSTSSTHGVRRARWEVWGWRKGDNPPYVHDDEDDAVLCKTSPIPPMRENVCECSIGASIVARVAYMLYTYIDARCGLMSISSSSTTREGTAIASVPIKLRAKSVFKSINVLKKRVTNHTQHICNHIRTQSIARAECLLCVGVCM